jgi:hypothetical protein
VIYGFPLNGGVKIVNRVGSEAQLAQAGRDHQTFPVTSRSVCNDAASASQVRLPLSDTCTEQRIGMHRLALESTTGQVPGKPGNF